MQLTRKLIGAALVAATWIAGPLEARERTISTTVAYDDLDLTTAEGAAELERRARIAVLRLCATYDRSDAVGERPLRRCRQSVALNPAVDAVVTQARLEANANHGARVAVK